jgi:hypothetical protein
MRTPRDLREAALRKLMADYVELRARSAFSFLEGASIPEDLASVLPTTPRRSEERHVLAALDEGETSEFHDLLTCSAQCLSSSARAQPLGEAW